MEMPPIRSRSSSQAPADHFSQLAHAGNNELTSLEQRVESRRKSASARHKEDRLERGRRQGGGAPATALRIVSGRVAARDWESG
eukprot:97584-Pleurochrysis_carterae.AAC.1